MLGTPTIKDLLHLIRDRGTAEGFPEPDELAAELEPFRTLEDQETVRLALAAAVRKSERLPARLSAQALALLGGDRAASILLTVVHDEQLALHQRAAAAWALSTALAGDLKTLSPDDAMACAGLPVLEMVSDPEADGGFGLEAFLGSYISLAAADRLPFVRMLAALGRQHGHGIASICLHLLKGEESPETRSALLDLAAADRSQEAADLIASFAAITPDRQLAKQARRQLHILRSHGIRGEVRSDLEGARAFVTGVDGDACLTVNISIPRPPTVDVANLLLHLGSGIRDGFVRRNLSPRGAEALIQEISGHFELSAFVPMPLAARLVDEAVALAAPGSIEEDVGEALGLAEPALAAARARPIPPETRSDELPPDVPIERIKELLESPGFESWFFEAGEATLRPSLEAICKPGRGKSGQPTPATFRKRLERETARACERMVATSEPQRLERMLRYQAHVLAASGDRQRAALCRALAAEVQMPGSTFLACMVMASILRALEAPEQPLDEQFLEARIRLRALLLHEESHPPKERPKRSVARLDLATAAFLELNEVNRQAPSSERISLGRLERAALSIGQLYADAFLKDGAAANPSTVHRHIVATLDEGSLYGPDERQQVAMGIMGAVTTFVDEFCTDRCPHACLDEGGADGRALFHAQDLPWDVDAAAVVHRPTGQRSLWE